MVLLWPPCSVAVVLAVSAVSWELVKAHRAASQYGEGVAGVSASSAPGQGLQASYGRYCAPWVED